MGLEEGDADRVDASRQLHRALRFAVAVDPVVVHHGRVADGEPAAVVACEVESVATRPRRVKVAGEFHDDLFAGSGQREHIEPCHRPRRRRRSEHRGVGQTIDEFSPHLPLEGDDRVVAADRIGQGPHERRHDVPSFVVGER